MKNDMKILDINIDNVTLAEAINRIDNLIKSPGSSTRLVTTLNPEIALKANRDIEYRKILNSSSLTIADGTGIIWASKKYRSKLKAKVTGVDLISQLTKISPSKKWRWYLLGGKPGVAKRATNNLIKKNPKINIVKADDGGVINGENFSSQYNLVARIAKYKPDILVVSLGAPIQEKFIHYYKNELNARVAIGAGGTLDFIAGVKKRAPKVLRWIGIEWLWRFIREPKRFKRIWNAVIVFPIVVKCHIKQTK